MSFQLLENESMARHTTFGVGGPARWFVNLGQATNSPQLMELIQADQPEVFILGGGSNLLVSDSGFDGLVVKMTDQSFNIMGSKIIASAGASLASVAMEATRLGLSGLEWAVGVPGTIGGAVRGNAGCFGGDMSQVTALVQFIDLNTGETQHLTATELGFDYRFSIFVSRGKWLITQVVLQLTPDEVTACQQRQAEFLQAKRQKQPLGQKCAGSVFKNPSSSEFVLTSDIPVTMLEQDVVPAGFLIESVNLKSHLIGDAIISPKHANFIINLGQATSADIVSLMELAKKRVRERYGVILNPEVQFLGSMEK